MADPNPLSNLLPGFDFLQGLVKNAGDAMPGMNQWIAPTLDPDEVDKRIRDLRTVQFWLDQNSKMISATVQALEVQRMTLSTLRTMNLPLADVRESMKLSVPAPAPSPAPETPAEPGPPPAARPARRKPAAEAPAAPAPTAGVVDPMQWWGALTQQFTELAAKAVQDLPAAAAVAAPAPATQPDAGGAPKRKSGKGKGKSKS